MSHDILKYNCDNLGVTPSIDRALHQFLTLLLILTLLPNLTFYLIARGFHRTFATGAACQQRTLTPPDTWSCPTLGLASVLMLRPISPELVLFLDFWVLNIPRYFCFCLEYALWQYCHNAYSNYHNYILICHVTIAFHKYIFLSGSKYFKLFIM